MAKPWRTGEGWILLYPSGTQSIGIFPSEAIARNYGIAIWGEVEEDHNPEVPHWRVIKMVPVGSVRWEPPVFACNVDESGGLSDG